MEEKKISKYDQSMHLVDGRCAVLCKLQMLGAMVSKFLVRDQ